MKLIRELKKLFWKTEKEVKKDIEKEVKEDFSKIEEKIEDIGIEIKEKAEEAVEFIEYKEKKWAKIGYSLIKKIFGPIVRKIWVHEVKGLDNVPKDGGVLIASNHESYFDFICFIAVSPRKIHYLAAEKFYKSKFWKPLMEITGQIKVDRTSHEKHHVHNLVSSALKQQRMIGIFPEGTRTRDGNMLKAFTGVARYALDHNVPVLPVGVIGTRDIMAPHDKRPKFNKKAKIKIGEPMYFHEHYGKEHDEKLLREVTDKIMLKIAELAEKEYPHSEKK